MDTIESIELIYRNPEVRRGMPCIVGTTIRVMDLAINMTYNDRSPQEMARDYDMPLEKVHAALAYYYSHQDEIDADIRADIKRSDELVREYLAEQGMTDFNTLQFRMAVAKAYARINSDAVMGKTETVAEMAESALG